MNGIVFGRAPKRSYAASARHGKQRINFTEIAAAKMDWRDGAGNV